MNKILKEMCWFKVFIIGHHKITKKKLGEYVHVFGEELESEIDKLIKKGLVEREVIESKGYKHVFYKLTEKAKETKEYKYQLEQYRKIEKREE